MVDRPDGAVGTHRSRRRALPSGSARWSRQARRGTSLDNLTRSSTTLVCCGYVAPLTSIHPDQSAGAVALVSADALSEACEHGARDQRVETGDPGGHRRFNDHDSTLFLTTD